MGIIRPATEDDIASLITNLGIHMNEEQKAVLLDKIERYVRKGDRALFIASNGSRITGFGCIIEKGDVSGNLSYRAAELAKISAMTTALFVHPDHRKKGIGAALLRSLEQWASDRGRAGNWLITHRKGYWYERNFGYERIGQVLNKGVEKTIMFKKFE